MKAQLEALDPQAVAEELGPEAVLLCWESFNVRCHRRMVAEWLEEKLGLTIPELGYDRAESLPYFKQQAKKTKAPPQLEMF